MNLNVIQRMEAFYRLAEGEWLAIIKGDSVRMTKLQYMMLARIKITPTSINEMIEGTAIKRVTAQGQIWELHKRGLVDGMELGRDPDVPWKRGDSPTNKLLWVTTGEGREAIRRYDEYSMMMEIRMAKADLSWAKELLQRR